MQGMLDNLSQPVAFATVPLGNPEAPNQSPTDVRGEESRRDGGALSSDTDVDEPIFSKFTRKIGLSREGSKGGRPGGSSRNISSNSIQSSYDDNDGDFEDFLEEGISLPILHSETPVNPISSIDLF
jgi:hypothetical protein